MLVALLWAITRSTLWLIPTIVCLILTPAFPPAFFLSLYGFYRTGKPIADFVNHIIVASMPKLEDEMYGRDVIEVELVDDEYDTASDEEEELL